MIAYMMNILRSTHSFSKYVNPFLGSATSYRCIHPIQSTAVYKSPFLLVSVLLLVSSFSMALAAFTDNGDGTATDSDTGLMWDRCGYGATGPSCGGGTQMQGSWQQALNAVTEANAANYKNYKDWRLPNKNELDSLIKDTTHNPAIDVNLFPLTSIPGTMSFWTSTTVISTPSDAWLVSFNKGEISSAAKTEVGRVRLVRAGNNADLLLPSIPVITNKSITNITGTSAQLNATSDTTGNGHWIVVAQGAATPTVDDVVAGIDYNGVTLVEAGSAAMVKNVATVFPTISSLLPSTAYDAYVVADNGAGVVSLLSGPITFTTTADSIPPILVNLSIVAGPTTISAVAVARIHEAGTGYWLNQLSSDTAPTATELVATGQPLNMRAATNVAILLTGLNSGIEYTLYFIAKDQANQLQASPHSLNYTTLSAADVTPPTSTLAIATAATTSTVGITAESNENGAGYWLNLPASQTAPDVATVRATGTEIASMVAATPSPINLTGLKHSTAYVLYFIAQDDAGNVESTVQAQPYTTLNDPAPTITLTQNTVGITKATIDAQINEVGTGYWLNQLTADPAPSVIEVMLLGTRIANMPAATDVPIALSDLTPNTSYTLYFVARDTAYNLSTLTSIAYTTDTAITATLTADGVPTETTADFEALLDKDGNGYGLYQLTVTGQPFAHIVRSNSTSDPTHGQGEQHMNAGTPVPIHLTDLLPGTSYTLYFIGEDDATGELSNLAFIRFTTRGIADTVPTTSSWGLLILLGLLGLVGARSVLVSRKK